MTIEEASEKYCIPIKILKEYESMELCKTVKRVMGEWHYDDEDIKRLSMIMTLYETGFSKEDIDEYQIKSRCSRYCRCLERIDYG